jgi:hypothetical protein
MADELNEVPVEQSSEVQPEVIVEKVEESPVVEETVVDAPKEEVVAEELKAEEPVVEESKEQLYRDVNPKMQIEIAKASEDEKVEVAPVEAEKPKEEVKVDVKSKKSDKEKLSQDIEATKEELSVIKEVREELVSLYASNKNLESEKEQLSKDNVSLKESFEQLTLQLQTYKAAEEKLTAEKRATRLEQLSAKFKVLGQEKSVEQLSSKDEETLSEFEKIVDAAIEKLADNKEQASVTESTQAEKLSDAKQPVEKISNAVAKVAPKKESLSNEKFFAGICNDLKKEQLVSKGTHRAKYL